MINSIIFAVWFFLPAGIANATPVFASQLPRLKNWNSPLDFGKSFRGKRIFGDNKTWRGLIAGILVAGGVAFIQNFWLIGASLAFGLQLIALSTLGGMLMGFGALAGDAIESFFKRQLGVEDGRSWFPFDQLDYIIGGLLASSLLVDLSANEYISIVITWFVLHIVAGYVAYLLKVKERPV